MSRSLRVQLSLIFTDEDLFDNFITPLKENKELSGLIIKLLKTYYDNDEVRELVEGISYDNVFNENSQVIDSTEAINQMRQTLAMQDFLFEQAKQTLSDGASEMDALMRANDIAQQSGVVKTESGENGEVLAKLTIENSTFDKNNQSDGKAINSDGLEDRVKRIEDAISGIFDLLKSGQYSNDSNASSDSVTVEKPDISAEIVTEIKEVEVPYVESNKTEVLPVSEVTQVVEVQEVKANNEDEMTLEEEDASGVLSDVLKDLLG